MPTIVGDMNPLVRTAIAVTVLFIVACATLLPATAESWTGGSRQEAPVAVEITREGDVWIAEYRLNDDAPVWAFHSSALMRRPREPWRPRDWRPETPGVSLERVGALDILRAEDGETVPRRVRLRLSPQSDDLEADYSNLIFTDGSIALPVSHFLVFPLASLEAARTAPGDKASRGAPPRLHATFRYPGGSVFHGGRRAERLSTDRSSAYVLFGAPEVLDSERLMVIADPQLPDWITRSIQESAPRTADYYAQRLGPGQTDKPTILASWNGPSPDAYGLSGAVLPGMIVMTFEGAGLMQPSPDILARTQWFIGHESAHFWLGQTIRYGTDRDAWITEGGADLMAVRSLTKFAPDFNARSVLQQSIDDCVTLADEPIDTVADRGELRARYACGAVFLMAAESLQQRLTDGDAFDFLRTLMDANRADGVVTADDWLDELERVGGSPALRDAIETLLSKGSPQAAVLIARIFEESGVPHEKEGEAVRLT